jgi:hypothetical protein
LKTTFRFLMSLVLSGLIPAQATTRYASSGSAADINSQVALSIDGDKIKIPVCDVTWANTDQVITTKRIIFSGNSESCSIIRRSGGTLPPFRFHALSTATNIFGVNNITLDQQSTPTITQGISIGDLNATNRFFRLHNICLTNMGVRGISIFGRSQGLIDRCKFYTAFENNIQGVQIDGGRRTGSAVTNNANSIYSHSFGDITNNICVENCYFNFSHANDSCIELYEDANATIRFVTTINAGFGLHEFGLNRSDAQIEVYGCNTFTPLNKYLLFRSGFGVVCSNYCVSAVGNESASNILLTYYRASGTNVFAAAPGNYVWDTGVTGTNRFDFNFYNDTGPIGYPGMDQPGWGDPTTWTLTNSVQTFYGIYQWNNTLNSTGNVMRPFCPGTASTSNCNAPFKAYDGIRNLPDPFDLIVEGRDYTNAVKSGWTPLTYPHPYIVLGD